MDGTPDSTRVRTPVNPAPRWPRTFVTILSEPSAKRLQAAINQRLRAIEDAGGQIVEVRPYLFGTEDALDGALIHYVAAEEVA